MPRIEMLFLALMAHTLRAAKQKLCTWHLCVLDCFKRLEVASQSLYFEAAWIDQISKALRIPKPNTEIALIEEDVQKLLWRGSGFPSMGSDQLWDGSSIGWGGKECLQCWTNTRENRNVDTRLWQLQEALVFLLRLERVCDFHSLKTAHPRCQCNQSPLFSLRIWYDGIRSTKF